MSSGSSAVRAALAEYAAGRMGAEALAVVVAEAYYAERRPARRDALRPVLDVVERAAPGVIGLASSDGGPGFALAAMGRPFPAEHEAALRAAALSALSALPEKDAGDGVLGRVWSAVQRWLGR